MASNYPGSLDSFDTIASDKKTSDSVGGRTHRQMHNDLGDAVEAVQAELGTDPAGSYATVKARLDALVAYAAKTGAYTATSADHTLNVTSGTFTLDLPAASTVTGQSLRVRNSGTGVVTLDGNSSETVDGVATFPLGSGSYVEITSTGSAWILTGGVPDTGWRDISSSLSNSWSGSLMVRRVGNTCFLRISGLSGNATWQTVASIPTGFAPAHSTYALGREVLSTGYPFMFGINTTTFGSAESAMIGSTWQSASWGLTVAATWSTVAAWPTSLPGSAA